MTKVICRKVNGVLAPVDEEGFEIFAKLKDGRDVTVDVKQSRNPRHHRLAFAIFRFVQIHSPIMSDRSIEEIKTAVKIATGYVGTFVDCQTGQTCYVPKSIAFEAMDQTEFNRFFDDACRVVATRWLPAGTTADDVRRELIQMCDGQYAGAA